MPEDHAWDRIVDAIEAKFGLADHGRFTRKLEDAPDLTEHVSFVVFERDGERFKLERTAGPAIIGRKTLGARRAGAVTRQETIYDAHETAFRTHLFREDGAGWAEIDPGALGL